MPTRAADTADAALESSPHALLPFLQSQSQNTLTRLYQRPSSCLSIFRLLLIVFCHLCISNCLMQAAGPFREANRYESSVAGIFYCCCDHGSMGYPRLQKVLFFYPFKRKVKSLNVSIDSMIMLWGSYLDSTFCRNQLWNLGLTLLSKQVSGKPSQGGE